MEGNTLEAWNMVYSTETERVVSMLFVSLCAVFTVSAQCLVMVTIVRTPALHTVHFYVIAGYCCADLTMGVSCSVCFLVQFLWGPLSDAHCSVLSTVTSSLLLGLAYHTGLLALERYVFFCRPYSYERVFRTRTVVPAVAACHALPLAVGVATELGTMGRTYHPSSMLCHLSDATRQYLGQTLTVLLPSALVTVFSSLRVWRLTRRLSVGPAELPSTSNRPVQQAFKGLRMVLLLSGTFWGTLIPSYILFMLIPSLGYSLDDLDQRRALGPAIVVRGATFLSTIVSSAVNPLIYYYSRRDLRTATWRLLRSRSNRIHSSSVWTTERVTGM